MAGGLSPPHKFNRESAAARLMGDRGPAGRAPRSCATAGTASFLFFLFRWTQALKNFVADTKIVLRDLHDRVVLVHRQPLFRDRFLKSIVGFGDDALLVGRGRRCSQPLLIILLEAGQDLEAQLRLRRAFDPVCSARERKDLAKAIRPARSPPERRVATRPSEPLRKWNASSIHVNLLCDAPLRMRGLRTIFAMPETNGTMVGKQHRGRSVPLHLDDPGMSTRHVGNP